MTSLAPAPQISQAELHQFFETHFSDGAIHRFGHQFLHPSPSHAQPPRESFVNPNHAIQDENEDYGDGLGYYSDGVKRTLTDDQIAIFRHSEIEAHRRAQHKQSQSEAIPQAAGAVAVNTSDIPGDSPRGHEQNDGEAGPVSASTTRPTHKKRNKNKNRRREPKPDLRKRTWDVVEPGLESLDYD